MKKIAAFFMSAVYLLFPTLIAVSVIAKKPVLPAVPADYGKDCIHFMNTGSSDAILLESDGHFALVDAGEDSDNPRDFSWLSYDGHEQEVLAYLKAHAADADGVVHLDFVLGTHAHSDHIGGFDTVILDPAVTIDRAYLKVYDSSKIRKLETDQWDNQEVYDQMVNALAEREVPIISQLDGTPFTLGNFTITLFNTVDPENTDKVGENDNSLGVLVEKNGTRVFLAGDINNNTGDESRLGPEIGKVDLLKPGHHCYVGSTTQSWVDALQPAACVITNAKGSPTPTVMARIIRTCRHKNIYITGNENGVLAVIGDNGDIAYYGQIFNDLDIGSK